jgi:hypothetical protein
VRGIVGCLALAGDAHADLPRLATAAGVYLDVSAFHHDVAQTQHVHAHRPHIRFATDDNDVGEAERIRAAVISHRQPLLPAMRGSAVVNEYARARRPAR